MRRFFVLLFLPASLFPQDAALARLKHEMAVARAQEQQDYKDRVARIATVHAALRDWLKPQLPKDVYSLAGETSRLEASLPGVLKDAGLSRPDSADADRDMLDPGFDEVGFQLKMMPELPDMLFVTATVKVPCGEDQAVYAYRFDSTGRTRVIDYHPPGEGAYEGAELQLSDPDSQGRRLLLIHRTSTQCASLWMGMTYAVYRLSLSHPPESLLSSDHGFWLNDDGPAFILRPNELMVEFLDSSVDSGIHNRTHILRYNFADGVHRIEPMAFQPQDFAEEWLTQPWPEMQSRSAPEIQKWHAKLQADFQLGDYSSVLLCAAKPDRWSIGFVGETRTKEPINAYFLVRDLGGYRYEMEAVSDSPFAGCPGEGSPSEKHPWLSVEQLKALP
jgi:hypothetical protein